MSGMESPFRNNPERGRERIHEQAEVLSLIAERLPGLHSVEELKGKITRELKDAQGLYLLELEMPGSVDGAVYEYRYVRAGNTDSKNASAETCIHVVLYEEGVPVTSDQLAQFNTKTQEWEK